MSRARDLADGTFSGAFAADSPTLVVDATNNLVGVGTTSPSSFNVNYNNLVVGSGSGFEGITIYTDTASSGGILFADGTTGTQPYEGQLKYQHASNVMTFHTNGGIERLRIQSGGGISFNGDTAAANALNDYEEGTFTPTAGNFSVSGTSTLAGKYTKIGRVVYFDVTFHNTGTIAWSASALITLPFSGVDHSGVCAMQIADNNTSQTSGKSGVQCRIDAVNSRFFLGPFTTTSSGQQFNFGGFYRVS